MNPSESCKEFIIRYYSPHFPFQLIPTHLNPTKIKSFQEFTLVYHHLVLKSVMKALVSAVQDNHDIIQKTATAIFSVYGHSSESLLKVIKIIIFEEANSATKNTIFRENCLATILINLFVEKIGDDFLKQIMLPIIMELIEDCKKGIDFEIDPQRIEAEDKDAILKINTENIGNLANKIITAIESATATLPTPITSICHYIYRAVEKKFPELAEGIVSSFFFLRFLCPSIISPRKSWFPESDAINSKTRRALVLVCRLIQKSANWNSEFPIEHVLEPPAPVITSVSSTPTVLSLSGSAPKHKELNPARRRSIKFATSLLKGASPKPSLPNSNNESIPLRTSTSVPLDLPITHELTPRLQEFVSIFKKNLHNADDSSSLVCSTDEEILQEFHIPEDQLTHNLEFLRNLLVKYLRKVVKIFIEYYYTPIGASPLKTNFSDSDISKILDTPKKTPTKSLEMISKEQMEKVHSLTLTTPPKMETKKIQQQPEKKEVEKSNKTEISDNSDSIKPETEKSEKATNQLSTRSKNKSRKSTKKRRDSSRTSDRKKKEKLVETARVEKPPINPKLWALLLDLENMEYTPLLIPVQRYRIKGLKSTASEIVVDAKKSRSHSVSHKTVTHSPKAKVKHNASSKRKGRSMSLAEKHSQNPQTPSKPSIPATTREEPHSSSPSKQEEI